MPQEWGQEAMLNWHGVWGCPDTEGVTKRMNSKLGNRKQEMGNNRLSMAQNHRIATSKGISEGKSWA